MEPHNVFGFRMCACGGTWAAASATSRTSAPVAEVYGGVESGSSDGRVGICVLSCFAIFALSSLFGGLVGHEGSSAAQDAWFASLIEDEAGEESAIRASAQFARGLLRIV